MKLLKQSNNLRKSGFTIVELLVVIVLIGILATITIVSYTGISQKATIASIQSDLTSSSKLLKMYYTEYGSYPVGNNMSEAFNSDKCPTTPNLNTKYCLKLSKGNEIDAYIGTTSTFSITIKNGTTKYVITHETAPNVAIAAIQPIFTTGGTINPATGTRTHTFTPGNYNLIATASGTINVTINGAGGGGGGGGTTDNPGSPWGETGATGGTTIVTLGATNYISYGGTGGTGGGDTWQTGNPGNSGSTNTPSGWAAVVGGGGAGGSGGTGDYPPDDTGGNGGAGGRLSGSLTIATGQTLNIQVGSGGIGGLNGYGDVLAGSGVSGSLTINYSY